jgi:hypothetical protein
MNLLAISYLHTAFTENREHLGDLRPLSDTDGLPMTGDVAERLDNSARAGTGARWGASNRPCWRWAAATLAVSS